MRIGFDANVLSKEKTAGAYYLAQLVRGLVKLNPRLELYLFSADKVCVDYDAYVNFSQVRRITLDLPREARKGWPGRYVPALLKEHRIQVFHQPCLDGASVFRPQCPTVVTVMGMGPWFLEGAFRSWIDRLRYRFNHVVWSRLAARTLTLSETTRNDLIRFCRVSQDMVVVTPPGAGSDELFSLSMDSADRITEKYGLLNKDYVINASGLSDKRHQLDFVLEGFARYCRQSEDDARLVVTGSINYEGAYDRAVRKMKMLGIRDRVVLTGFVSDTVFYALLRNARAMVISSMYPGISFAMTESFAAGVPVIASDCGCFPEVAGEAAAMVNLYDTEALAMSLQRLLGNAVEHDLYVEKGVKRVKAFSWERMAEQTFNVYLSVTGG